MAATGRLRCPIYVVHGYVVGEPGTPECVSISLEETGPFRWRFVGRWGLLYKIAHASYLCGFDCLFVFVPGSPSIHGGKSTRPRKARD